MGEGEVGDVEVIGGGGDGIQLVQEAGQRTTLLGTPVLPLVYMMMARISGLWDTGSA